MNDHEAESGRDRWARLRFAIVGPLLAAPPARRALRAALGRLAAQSWQHPRTRAPVRFAFPTIERWYYAARNATHDPVGVLRHRRRKDAGQQRALSARLQLVLQEQYQAHPSWSYQLQLDNLQVVIAEDPTLGPPPSYSTLRRYMTAQALRPAPRTLTPETPGATVAAYRRAHFEVRSFEAEHVHGLWHLDFHHGSRKVLSRTGAWSRPRLLGVLDDRSRLACHLQWYLDETAETLVHGLAQAIQKRGVPRALLTDNGSAMLAAEVRQGLETLGIVHETTLPYSPYQNAKQEVFWAQVEGRLLAMLEGETDLTLERLNVATQAWVELAYHRTVHRELGCAPLERYLAGPEVGRPSPSSEALRRAFRAEVARTQRRSDGTVSLEGRRFEVPARYRHLTRLHVRYARWDLGASISLILTRTSSSAPFTRWTRRPTPMGSAAGSRPPRRDRQSPRPRRRTRRCCVGSWPTTRRPGCRPRIYHPPIRALTRRSRAHDQEAPGPVWPQVESVRPGNPARRAAPHAQDRGLLLAH